MLIVDLHVHTNIKSCLLSILNTFSYYKIEIGQIEISKSDSEM